MTYRNKALVYMLGSLLLPALSACGDPKQDKFHDEGGISPDPAGVIEGTIVYLGPRPRCTYEGKTPKAIEGFAFLTLFEYDNPPPPEGRATSAVNAFALRPDALFSLEDCGPKDKEPDPKERIMRSTAFRWPQIALSETEKDYQVRGFFDADADLNPRFGVTNLPTQGDVIGAALKDVENPQLGFLKIHFEARKDAENGEIVRGVTVTLGNYVWSERPMFELSTQHRVLSSSAIVPVVADLAAQAPNVPETMHRMHELTCSSAMPPVGCGLSIKTLDPRMVKDTFAAAGLKPSFEAEKYAFFSEPVDVRTVVMGGPDVSLPDGQPDPHPVLGSSLGLPWTSPMVLLSRLAVTSEAAVSQAQLTEAAAFATKARIPTVTLVGSVLPDATAQKRVFVDEMAVAVAPIAVVDLDPKNPTCRVPYAAPGNFTTSFESRVAHCGDLPTGVFGVSVLAGVASGALVDEPDNNVSESGVRVLGARFSGQAWTLPNDLGNEAQVGAENALSSQGPEGLFFVTDPDLEGQGDCSVARDPEMVEILSSGVTFKERPVRYKTLCKEGESAFSEDATGIDSTRCLPTECCEAVEHLCGLPLCKPITLGKVKVRANPMEAKATAKNGALVPTCIPFELPRQCCN